MAKKAHRTADWREVAARIGASIRQHRKQCEMTQQQLATACGMCTSAISRIEKGQMNLRLNTLLRITEFLCLSVRVHLLPLETTPTHPASREE